MNIPIIAYRANMGVQTSAPFTNISSLSFDGVDDYVDLGSGLDIFDYEANQSYTVSLWYKTTITTSFNTILNLSANSFKFSLVTGLNGTISFAAGSLTLSINFINKWLPTSGAINDGNWHHVCITQDSSGGTINLTPYVDGSNSGSSPSSTFQLVESNNRIGFGQYGGLNGNIDEVSIFDRVVTAAEIVTLSTAPTVDLTSLNPISWYRNGDGDTYSTITDNGSGGNDGTMTNMDAGDIVSDVPL